MAGGGSNWVTDRRARDGVSTGAGRNGGITKLPLKLIVHYMLTQSN